MTTFGPFAFDPGSGALTRDGQPVALGGRAAALLGALVKAEGAIVSRAELTAAAWPGVIVEEGNLTVQITGLRKALGARADGSEWIVTVARVGYRLMRDGPSPDAKDKATRLPSLAVLPFQNLGGDPEQEYFADGVVEDIITALSRFQSFSVVARNSSFVYKGRAVDVREVAGDLGVRYVLEGSVRRSGSRLRITAQLVDGETGAHLWAGNFDGVVDDIFDMQDRVTENVAAIIEPRVKRAEIDRARRTRPDSIDVYDLYLRALPDAYAGRPETIQRAIEVLEDAARRDPGFAPALAMAAQAYLLRIVQQLAGGTEADRTRSVALARAALATGSDDPAVMSNCGFVLLHVAEEYDEGLALLQRALLENPNHPTVLTFTGIGCLIAGDLDEGASHLERSIRLNPNDFGAHWQLTGIGHIRTAQGRYEEALSAANRSLAVNTNYLATYWVLIAANAYLGRMDVARDFVARLEEMSPGVTLSRIMRGQLYRYPERVECLVEGMRLAGLRED